MHSSEWMTDYSIFFWFRQIKTAQITKKPQRNAFAILRLSVSPKKEAGIHRDRGLQRLVISCFGQHHIITLETVARKLRTNPQGGSHSPVKHTVSFCFFMFCQALAPRSENTDLLWRLPPHAFLKPALATGSAFPLNEDRWFFYFFSKINCHLLRLLRIIR